MSQRTYYSDDAKMSAQRKQAAMGLASLVTGMGLGAAIALVFGTENDDGLQSRVQEAIDEGGAKMEDLLHTLEEEYPDVFERINNAVNS